MNHDTDQNSTDYVAAITKAALGMVPLVGSLLSELAGTIIPKQRIDRISDLAKKLEHKLGVLDEGLVRAKLTDENFTDLFEETVRHAASAVTEERREYLASLLATGVSEEKVSFIETKHLLRILGQINDIEVIWLRFYYFPFMSGDDHFRRKHAGTIEPVVATLGCDEATIDKQALQRNYVQHLISLGVLERPLMTDSKTGLPIFDPHERTWKTRSHQVTPLGKLLLRYIGLSKLEEDDDLQPLP